MQDIDDEPAAGITGEALTIGYHKTTVVRDAAIELRSGVVTALVGPNGSGKSTLLRALAQLHRPTSGSVTLPGDVAATSLTAKEFARRVTLLAQSRPTPTGVTVRDVVGYGRYPYRSRWRSDDADGQAAIDAAIEVTGIGPMTGRAVNELSGGELQRVWLATCLAQDTGVLLLDEPTTFLDLRYQVEILDLIRDLATERAVAVGVVLHDLNHAASIADEVVLLDAGRIRASGKPADVLTPEHLTATYGITIDVATDPSTGYLATRPVGRHTHRTPEPSTA